MKNYLFFKRCLFLLLMVSTSLCFSSFFSQNSYNVWLVPSSDVKPVHTLIAWYPSAEFQCLANIEISLDDSNHSFQIFLNPLDGWQKTKIQKGFRYSVFELQELVVNRSERKPLITASRTKDGAQDCQLGMVTPQQLMMHTQEEIKTFLSNHPDVTFAIDTGHGGFLSVDSVVIVPDTNVLLQYYNADTGNIDWTLVPATVYQFVAVEGGEHIILGEFALGGSETSFENIVLHFHYALGGDSELWYMLAPYLTTQTEKDGVTVNSGVSRKNNDFEVIEPLPLKNGFLLLPRKTNQTLSSAILPSAKDDQVISLGVLRINLMEYFMRRVRSQLK